MGLFALMKTVGGRPQGLVLELKTVIKDDAFVGANSVRPNPLDNTSLVLMAMRKLQAHTVRPYANGYADAPGSGTGKPVPYRTQIVRKGFVGANSVRPWFLSNIP